MGELGYAQTTMTAICVLALTLTWAPLSPLTVPDANVNKGKVKSGPVITHTFKLQHALDSGLIQITGIDTSCGCIKAVVKNPILSKGGSTECVVELNTLTPAEGMHTWTIEIQGTYDCPGQETSKFKQKLSIVAEIEREITVSPPMLSFSYSGDGREARQAITVKNHKTNQMIAITHAEATDAKIITQKQNDGTVMVSLSPEIAADGRPHAETVVLRTSDPNYPELRVLVNYVKNANDGLVATPAKFDLSQATPSAVVQLRDAKNALLTIQSATCDRSGVTVKFSDGANPVVAIRATIDPAIVGQSGQANIVVTLANGVVRTIPIHWK